MRNLNTIKDYKAYLFDMDGTLVDSEKLKGRSLVETCILFGGKVHVDTYKTVMGESWENVAAYFFEKAQISPDIVKFNSEFKRIYQQMLFQELTTNKNVVELLTYLKKKNKKIGVVSSAFGWMVHQILAQLNLRDFFDIVVTKEHVSKHKPDPEAYLLALEKLSVSGSAVLVFEDSNSGLIAAQKAKCDSVAFLHDFNLNHDFSIAVQVISDFSEFLATK